ncbi:MAG: hypothetical protein IKI95_01565 [Clostridia bacterium]|nr:hypothetical protein [Clostridia bacterium]
MININDKNGKITIQIEGNKIENLLTINEIVMDLSKTDKDIASAFIFGVLQTRGREFIEECFKREVRAKQKTNELFENASKAEIKDIIKEIKEILGGGSDE